MPHASPANLRTEETSQKAVKEKPGKNNGVLLWVQLTPHGSPANLSTEEESKKAVKEKPGKNNGVLLWVQLTPHSSPANLIEKSQKAVKEKPGKNTQLKLPWYVHTSLKEEDIRTEIASVKAMN